MKSIWEQISGYQIDLKWNNRQSFIKFEEHFSFDHFKPISSGQDGASHQYNTKYSICSPEKTRFNSYDCRSINRREETLCSNTAFMLFSIPAAHLSLSATSCLGILVCGRMCLCKAALASSSCRWFPHLSTVHCFHKSAKSSPCLRLRMSHWRRKIFLTILLC